MGAEAELLARLKNEFGQRPVVSNVVFGFFLAAVEKIVEVEFACPCNPKWNAVFVAPFFLIPAVTASLLMLLIHGYSVGKSMLVAFLPPVVWLALMLLNGQYVVCAKTDWPGTFVTTDKTYLKWCEPTNTTIYSSEELLNRSHRFYILSQVRTK
ncbi:calcium homeostasis modulator protein 6-like [Lates japonicus]